MCWGDGMRKNRHSNKGQLGLGKNRPVPAASEPGRHRDSFTTASRHACYTQSESSQSAQHPLPCPQVCLHFRWLLARLHLKIGFHKTHSNTPSQGAHSATAALRTQSSAEFRRPSLPYTRMWWRFQVSSRTDVAHMATAFCSVSFRSTNEFCTQRIAYTAAITASITAAIRSWWWRTVTK